MFTWSTLVLAALTATASTTGLNGIHYDAPTPDFAIPAARGTQHLYGLRGRVVVIDFWATWCPPCTAEMKYFVRAQHSYADRIAVVTVSSEPHDVAASYFRTWNIELPVVEDLTGAISRLYSVSKFPITLVLDPRGNVSYVSVGGLSWKELQGAIDRASGQAETDAPGSPAPRVLP